MLQSQWQVWYAGQQKTCNSVRSQCTLFSSFEYMPHDYGAAQQQTNLDRARSKAAQSQVSLQLAMRSIDKSCYVHWLHPSGQSHRLQGQTSSLPQRPGQRKRLGLTGSYMALAIRI